MSGVETEATPLPDQVVHEYDGIQEYDNKLPSWWLLTFYGAIVFAVGYWFTFHVFEAADLPMQAYRKDMAAAAEREGKSTVMTAPELLALSRDPAVIKDGEKLFAQTCVSCHGPKAGGNIGPNLTDEYWLHGGDPEKIYATIFRRIERAIEGPREKRLRRNAGPWTLDKLWRKALVHGFYVFFSLLLAHVFLSYFVSIRAMFAMMREAPAAHPEAFVVVAALTAVFYVDFAWFREQFCVVVCP